MAPRHGSNLFWANFRATLHVRSCRYGMKFSKVHIAIAVGAAFLVLLGFFFYLMWLNSQPPVLARSEEVDPLTKVPVSLKLNPLRDRASERQANEFLHAMREG